MMKNNAADLTIGVPFQVIARYSVPMLISMLFQQVYNLADSIIAGHAVGLVGLGAVGTCYPITVFYLAIASGLGVGTSVYIAGAYGAGEYKKVREGSSTAIIIYLVLSIIILAASIPLVTVMLAMLDVPDKLFAMARSYLVIYLCGIPFLFLYNLMNGISNGIGDSRTPLYFLIGSSIINVVFNLVFVYCFTWGVAGLALATALSQGMAGIGTGIAVKYELRKNQIKDARLVCLPILKEMLILGIPSVLQHLFMSLGQLSLQRVINSYGVIVITGYSVAFRINGVVINSFMALSNAVSGYVAQNKGAKKYKRISTGINGSLKLSYLFAAMVIVVIFVFGEYILALFLKDSLDKSSFIREGIIFLRIISPFYFLVNLKIITDGALRGMGAMKPFLFAAFADVLVRILCGSLFSKTWGIIGYGMYGHLPG